jgi:hypothetical protein
MMFLLLEITRMESGSRWHPRDANQDQLFRYFRACRLAPVLPFSESGNFGTSPFFGQHFKPLRLYRALMAVSEVNSNSGKCALSTFQLSGCALTRSDETERQPDGMSPPGQWRHLFAVQQNGRNWGNADAASVDGIIFAMP